MTTIDSLPAVDPSIFTHQKLDLSQQQIRILRLLPGEWSDPIQCSLYIVYMSMHPPYEALSYAWGDATNRRPIFIDGTLCQVTSNLAAALRRLRTPAQDRHLWVDAVCINQMDNTEKSHQVNLMRDIYSNAEEGLLWLGDFEEDHHGTDSTGPVYSISSNEHLSHTQNLSSVSDTDSAPPALGSTIISQAAAAKAFSLIRRLASNDHIPHENLVEETQALNTLMNLAWWQRMWTVQEAILPRKTTIICGWLSMDWNLLASAASNVSSHNNQCCSRLFGESTFGMLVVFHQRVGTITEFRMNEISMFKLRSAFIFFQNRLASDPRDKVFGLLGLFPSQMQYFSKGADYSLSKQEVYKRMTFHLIKEYGNLFPLLRGDEKKRRRTLPSWVPDLEAKIDETMLDLAMQWLCIYNLFDATSGSQLELGNRILNHFRLKGVFVDEISVLMEFKNLGDAAGVVEQLKGLVTSAFSLQDDYPMGGTYEDAFWRTLRRDYSVESNQDGSGAFRRLRPSEFHDMGNVDIRDLYDNEAFCLTKNGLIGVGPAGCRVDDRVYVLFGGKLPFILRSARRRGKQNCFKYIGPGYVHGIMDGEALETKVDPDDITLI
ncbi:hypothetical protein PFICI_11272 [Pestalotiopsis fici W106-1]|uniref:Heterokaryon incompatibility domain-containing protein n=1 Tax=Pestalotiopsis fici (strain W106-1 / CGMCC3.15140) TaxID=1229662 RepID=W3WU42_PESFW|nr:uncharacterized protein PFICI_11272 [Pestalotiopsis fici W106-1]ETS77398.1 hypothetical protein PFICI_11272 [Pestalotiopsis fici W106-1]